MKPKKPRSKTSPRATYSAWSPDLVRTLKAWMAALGVGQAELARRLQSQGQSVSQPAIGRLLDGRTAAPRKPSPEWTAVALEISLGQLRLGPGSGVLNAGTAASAAARQPSLHKTGPGSDGTGFRLASPELEAVHESLRASAKAPRESWTVGHLVALYELTSYSRSLPARLEGVAHQLRYDVVRCAADVLFPSDDMRDHEERIEKASDYLRKLVENLRQVDSLVEPTRFGRA